MDNKISFTSFSVGIPQTRADKIVFNTVWKNVKNEFPKTVKKFESKQYGMGFNTQLLYKKYKISGENVQQEYTILEAFKNAGMYIFSGMANVKDRVEAGVFALKQSLKKVNN